MRRILLAAVILSCCLSVSVFAGSITPYLLANGNIGIVVDENGHGTINGFAGLQALPWAIMPDPGPGGLQATLTYDMLNPPGLTAGDVWMADMNDPNCPGCLLDLIRFNPDAIGPGGGMGTLVFYSDNTDGYDSLADTPSPPLANYPNVIIIDEIEVGGVAYGHYIPLPGQPGFVVGASAPVEYWFISDVPEPGSLLLLASGGVLLYLRRRRVA